MGRDGTEVLEGKHIPLPLCHPQTPHGLTWDRTRGSTVSKRLGRGTALTSCQLSINY